MQKYVTEIGNSIPVVVWFEYEPAEPDTFESPGCGRYFKISAIHLNGYSHVDLQSVLDVDTIGDLTRWCIESVEEECLV